MFIKISPDTASQFGGRCPTPGMVFRFGRTNISPVVNNLEACGGFLSGGKAGACYACDQVKEAHGDFFVYGDDGNGLCPMTMETLVRLIGEGWVEVWLPNL